MEKNDEKRIHVDVLKHIEDLSNQINKMVGTKTQSVFGRYPITFSLMILLGVTAVHEGLKGLLEKFGLLDVNPWYLLITGLVILTITGTLYKKLEE